MTPTGHKEATHDPELIESWWSQWPDANIGIATGGISELLVLDVDEKNGGFDSLTDVESQHGSLPETLRVRTGGGGLHFYFSVPDGESFRNSAGKIANGIDVRADGGYVVAPPSNHVSGGRYDWL